MPRFSIIIVSWNALHHLKTFLPSVAATNYNDYEIILADNASTDGSAEWVERNYPQVKIATFDKNYGYCGGNNRAVPHADGDILIFLNNDVEVEPKWLRPLAGMFDQNPKIAAAQPKIRSYKEPDYFEYAGAAGGYLDKYGFPFCRGRLFDTIEEDYGQYDKPGPILWASGAALAIRKELFEELKGFDEDFEFHMEEIDLCWQLWNRGYEVHYCPQSVVYHLGGGSLPSDSPRKLYYNYRNNLKLLWKNYSDRSLVVRFPVRLLLDIIAAMHMLFTNGWSSFKSIIMAHKDFWLSVKQTHNKRKALLRKRVEADDPRLLMPKNLVWEYFIMGRTSYKEITDEKHRQ